MTAHLKMNESQPAVLDEMAQGVIGAPTPRRDGPLKVTGQAAYAAEVGDGTEAVGMLVRAHDCKRARDVNR